MDYLSLFSKSIFVDNMIFTYYLGMCFYLTVFKDVKTLLGLGLAVTFIFTCMLPISYLLEAYVSKAGTLSWLGAEFASVDLSFLSPVVFITVIASFAQLIEMAVERYNLSLYNSLSILLSPIIVNYAILGGSLLMQQRDFINTGMAAACRFGSGTGRMLAIIGLTVIRERLACSNIPKPLRGLDITLIVTGLMSTVFLSFSGAEL